MTPIDLLGLFDGVVRELAGSPVRVRVALGIPLAFGWAQRVHVVLPGVVVAGLRVREVDARLTGVRVVPGAPPRFRVQRLDVRVRVDESAFDEWARSVALPVRLRLRPGAIEARTGFAGVRLGGLQVDVGVDDRGRLRVAPKRVSLLGVGVGSGALPAVALPLPPLPRRARLIQLDPDDGLLTLTFAVAAIDEPLSPARLSELARSCRTIISQPPRQRAGRPAAAKGVTVPGVSRRASS